MERLQKEVEAERKLNETYEDAMQRVSEGIDQLITEILLKSKRYGCGGSLRTTGDVPSCDCGGDGGDCC